MAHLASNGRGSLILRRSFKGVGEIRLSTGTRDPMVVEQIDLMLHSLYGQGRLDLLEAIRAKRLHPLKALAEWRQGRELTMPAPELLPTLIEAWTAWENAVPGDDHRSSIGTTRRALKIPAAARIDALPDLLASFMERNKAKVRTVNLARAHCRAFLRDLKGIGTAHPLYARVAALRPLKRKPREKGTPHALPTIVELVGKLNELQAGVGDMAWSMAVSGMGNKEYWHQGFEVLRDRVTIYGQKREGRTRDVPMWSAPLVKPVCWEGRFRDLLREASGGTVAPYDLRRSFARWCEEAGIIETNRDAYLGHGPRSMTQLYTFGQLPGQLQADAAKLRAYRERELAQAVAEAAEA
jgi:integrase